MSSSPAVLPIAVRSIIYLGMDVHKESITIAVLPDGAKAPARLDRLPNDLPKLKRWLDRVTRDGEIRACYEASGAGYVLHRAMREWGYVCEVIAPSLIPKRPGVQRKHDKRATDLVRLYRAGELTAVRLRLSRGHQLVHPASQVAPASHDRRLSACNARPARLLGVSRVAALHAAAA